MAAKEYDEGDKCPKPGCKGDLAYINEEGCSCHISPPCSNCVDAPLICDVCGLAPDSED